MGVSPPVSPRENAGAPPPDEPEPTRAAAATASVAVAEEAEDDAEVSLKAEERNRSHFLDLNDVTFYLQIEKVSTSHGNTNSCLQYAFLVASGDMDKREQKQKYAHATPPNLSLRTTHPANHTCCVPVRRESKTRVAELRKQVHHELLKKLREDEPENENRVDSWRYGMSVERVRCIAHSTLAPHIACAPLLTLPQS